MTPTPTPPRLVEDRRLKVIGLGLVFIACAGFAILSDHASAQWPIVPARFALFAVGCVVVVNLFAAGLLLLDTGCGRTHASSPAPRRRAVFLLRLTLANLLAPAFLYGVTSSDPVVEAEFERRGWDTVFGAVIAVLVVVAWRLWRLSRQYGAIDADEAMALDPRAPVLYLRSFADDGDALIGETSKWLRLGARIAMPVTPEQEMADLLDAVGPVVAIGKPGEPLPELGAARLYVSNEQWQAKVQELMQKARLVVLRLGSSPGLIWEIEQVLAHLPRQRLVFAVLGGSVVAPAVAQRLAPVLGSTFMDALPQALPATWTQRLYRDPRRRIGGIVYFDAAGAAHAVPVKRWPIQAIDIFMMAARPSAGPLRRAWRQVFAPLGLVAPVGRRSRAVAVSLAMSFGWAGGHWFYLGQTRRGWLYVAMLPLLLAPMFLGFRDAFRFLWVDRQEFDSRFSALEGAAPHA
ncbi:MAG: TM2 domain-containing protein [Caldimonas sp.]